MSTAAQSNDAGSSPENSEAVRCDEWLGEQEAAYKRQLELGAAYHALGDVEMVGRCVREAARIHMLVVKRRRSPSGEVCDGGRKTSELKP